MTGTDRTVYAVAKIADATARINVAIECVREASTGYVAVHADPDGDRATERFWERLRRSLDALIAAREEGDRLLSNEVSLLSDIQEVE
jgi:hypothetical protein